MQTDFRDAHERHWEDAELLFEQSRWANADHLYGLAAECGLKRLMIAFGMKVAAGGGPQLPQDRVHADQVWDRYETYRSGYNRATYILPNTNPFADWHIGQRYAHRSDFDQDRAQRHRNGAETVRKLINKAEQEGLL